MTDFGISQFISSRIVAPRAENVSDNLRSTSYLRWTIPIPSAKGIAPLSKTVFGTLRWCAHEQFVVGGEEPVPHTDSTDIWAFGMATLVGLQLPLGVCADDFVTGIAYAPSPV